MGNEYINLTLENLDDEHLCCAIADKKHQTGVLNKKEWLKERIPEGHVFRKLNARGKVFIEYAPLEKSWVPVVGSNYVYIYCLWVSGSFKGKGHARDLIQYCIDDAKDQGKSGICILSSKKKKPFLADPKFFKKFGFESVDNIGDYELMALSFDGAMPNFTDSARDMKTDSKNMTIYYSVQCPLISNCIEQLAKLCDDEGIDLDIMHIDTLDKAKNTKSIFNNWAVFQNGEFITNHLLNEGLFRKTMLGQK